MRPKRVRVMSMIAIAPKISEVFEQWKANPYRDKITWTQHWENVWAQHIAMYLSMNWHLIPLAPKSKKPMQRFHWDVEKPLDQVRAMDFVRSGCNLAVVAGPSNLVILDFDSDIPPELRDMLHLTQTVRTPRGYQFFCKSDVGDKMTFQRYVRKLKRRFPNMDTPRTDIMYALVPPSQSDRNNEESENPDYRVRLWVSHAENTMAFSRFVRIVA